MKRLSTINLGLTSQDKIGLRISVEVKSGIISAVGPALENGIQGCSGSGKQSSF